MLTVIKLYGRQAVLLSCLATVLLILCYYICLTDSLNTLDNKKYLPSRKENHLTNAQY